MTDCLAADYVTQMEALEYQPNEVNIISLRSCYLLKGARSISFDVTGTVIGASGAPLQLGVERTCNLDKSVLCWACF